MRMYFKPLVHSTRAARCTLLFSVLRIVFIPLFILALFAQRKHSNAFFAHDSVAYALIALHGLTNGYLASKCDDVCVMCVCMMCVMMCV